VECLPFATMSEFECNRCEIFLAFFYERKFSYFFQNINKSRLKFANVAFANNKNASNEWVCVCVCECVYVFDKYGDRENLCDCVYNQKRERV